MRVLKSLGFLLLCLGIAVTAQADLQTGTWTTTTTGGVFDVGQWEEQLDEGRHGWPGNQLSSFGANYDLLAWLDSVTPLGSMGGMDGYETVYSVDPAGVGLFDGPWDTDATSEYWVAMDMVVVTSWKSDTRLTWSLTGAGTLGGYDVLIKAMFDSDSDRYFASAPVAPETFGIHGGDVGWAQITIVPVPGAVLLAGLGFGSAGCWLRRFRNSTSAASRV